MRYDRGYTLLELMMSVSMLVVVTLLMFLAVRSSTAAANVASAKEQSQASVRQALSAIALELQLASKSANDALVPPLLPVRAPTPQEVVFQVPQDQSGAVWSQPITLRFINEDALVPETANNGRLDSGEDANGDGVLTRQIVRVQGNQQTVVGGTNNLSEVQFQISPTNDVVTVTVAATVSVNNCSDLVSSAATSSIYLFN